jgi:biopolymer transport protein TolQ
LRTLGSLCFALLLQGPDGALPAAGASGSATTIVELVTRSSPISKIVLGLLVLLSVVSWSIVLHKLWTFRKLQQQSASFTDVFRRSSKFSEVQAVCRSLHDCPLVGLFQAGYAELSAQLRPAAAASEGAGTATQAAASPTLKSLAAIDRALMRASVVEMNKLEHRIAFLATTASIAPFVGLFGTVWGIMAAFQGIGQTGSTNLGVVAPGIAEALVATAAGLVAAIPAVYFYNLLSHRVKLFASEMDDFAMEFLNIAERNFT